jgi:hypothetical protein
LASRRRLLAAFSRYEYFLHESSQRASKGVQISHAASPQLFYRASPATYGLLEWLTGEQLEDLETDAKITESAEQDALDSSLFLERELHQWLYKNLRENGLKAFGYGNLTEYNPQNQPNNLGKFKTGLVGVPLISVPKVPVLCP